MKPQYYDGTKLLSLMDINGNKPEIYICTTNRTGGKTTYFGRLCVNRWKDKHEKFALLYRYKYEMDDCAEKFFKDIRTLFFPDMEMTSKSKAGGIFHELYLDGEGCGYALALNSADQIKSTATSLVTLNAYYLTSSRVKQTTIALTRYESSCLCIPVLPEGRENRQGMCPCLC